MVKDRYLTGLLTLIALALGLIALNPWLEALRPAPAVAQGSAAKFELEVPKVWGKVIGYSDGNLLLQAADGTLREVDVRGKAPEYPKVKSLVKQN